MKCAAAQSLSSAYLDGELSAERSAAVRGHLRSCDACAALFAEERELVEASARLERPEPPARIWDAIQARIAEEEIRDSEQSALRLWWRSNWRACTSVGAVAVAAAVVLLIGRPALQSASTTAASSESPVAAVETSEDLIELHGGHDDLVASELEQADRDYIATIEELRTIALEDRETWTPSQARIFDEQIEGFRKDAIGRRLEMASRGQGDHRELHAAYRQEIDFLQDVLAGEFPETPSRGGAPLEMVP